MTGLAEQDPEYEADDFGPGAGGFGADDFDDAPGETIATGGDALIEVPSGQPVWLMDVIRSVAGSDRLAYRFRFHAPWIAQQGGKVDFETAAADMAALCAGYALPRVADFGPQPGRIIISLADQPVAFGDMAPGVTQYFDAFSIENDRCIWEMF